MASAPVSQTNAGRRRIASAEVDPGVRVPPRLRVARVRMDGDEWIVFSYPLVVDWALEQLTAGEGVVVSLALTGLSNAQIAQIRGAAKRTVANQLASAYRKLGGASRARLAALVEAKGGKHAHPATVFVGFVQAVYRLGVAADSWLSGLIAGARPLFDQGHGVVGWLRERADAAPLYLADARADTASRLCARERVEPLPHGFSTEGGMLLLSARQGGATVTLGAPVSQPEGRLPAAQCLSRMEAHLHAGLRLRALEAQLGTCVTEPCAAAFESLRGRAVAALEAPSAGASAGARGAAELWNELVRGHLLRSDSFDVNGRRYLLTRTAQPGQSGRAPLSPRQCRALALRRVGHPLKVIAAELGCSLSTASLEIQRATRSLGLGPSAWVAAVPRAVC